MTKMGAAAAAAAAAAHAQRQQYKQHLPTTIDPSTVLAILKRMMN
jgi:hypothetical protein